MQVTVPPSLGAIARTRASCRRWFVPGRSLWRPRRANQPIRLGWLEAPAPELNTIDRSLIDSIAQAKQAEGCRHGTLPKARHRESAIGGAGVALGCGVMRAGVNGFAFASLRDRGRSPLKYLRDAIS